MISCAFHNIDLERTIIYHLYLLYLVLDDSLLMFDGGLQVFVSLQQSVAQLGSQLEI